MSGLLGVGRAEEERAAAFLVEQGYTIVKRRYKARRGEIDIVALDGEQLAFVEVKARFAAGYVPEEALTSSKRRALARAGRAYLLDVGEIGRPVRFDLVAIDRDGIRLHKDVMGV